MANNYLNYTDKDYKSILEDLTNAIPSVTDLWTSREDGDPGMVLLKLISAVGDMLSYNMDKQALEYYAPTVTQRKNAQKLFNLIGYKMHWYRSAKTELTITNIIQYPKQFKYFLLYKQAKTSKERFTVYNTYIQTNPNTNYKKDNLSDMLKWVNEQTIEYNKWVNLQSINGNNIIKLHLNVDDPNNTLSVYHTASNRFYTIIPTTNIITDNNYPITEISMGDSIIVDAIEGSLKSVKFTYNNLKDNKFILPESSIDESHMWLKVNSSGGSKQSVAFFTLVDNLLVCTDGKLYFEFNIDDYDYPYIELCSYWSDIYDKTSVKFTLYYIKSSGVNGNISANYLNTINNISNNTIMISHKSNSSTYINEDGKVACEPGYNPQSAREAYIDSINYITTYETIVTIYDFERFTKRQSGISNAIAIDGQRCLDLNKTLAEKCDNLSLNALKDILKPETWIFDVDGKHYESCTDTKYTEYECTQKSILAKILYDRKLITYNIFGYSVSASNKHKMYGLNIHTVYGDFDTKDNNDNNIAIYTDTFSIGNNAILKQPYYIYALYTGQGSYSLPDINDNNYITSIKDNLDSAFKERRIVNVKPEYVGVRVFPWRACGTIYLTQPVTKLEATNIIKTVISNLTKAFHPKNQTFGEKITYMNVIDIITLSSDKIRYFDAGIGNTSLIMYENGIDDSYFNDISLMRYVQTYTNNEQEYLYDEDNNITDTPNPYYHLLTIDNQYIME